MKRLNDIIKRPKPRLGRFETKTKKRDLENENKNKARPDQEKAQDLELM